MRPHPDVDLLALHALGEPTLGEAERSHVAGCADCSRTVDELAGTVLTVRGPAVDEVTPVPVPAHVWQDIAAELDLQPSVRPASVGPSVVRLPQPTGARADAGAVGDVGDVGEARHSRDAGALRSADRDAPPVAGAAGGARHPGLRLLAVAAAGLVVGAAGAVAVGQLREGGAAPGGGTVLAAADLVEFGAGEGSGVNGSARLSTVPVGSTDVGTDGSVDGSTDDGDRVLQVQLDQLPDPGEDFLEAWLIDPVTGAMVSLGPVPTREPGAAVVELSVPRGLDVAVFTLVDVSAEPLDGDPTHSGDSRWRGRLVTG